jgi:hypothetical protein
MTQQTAVEWFYQRILAEDIKLVFEQAKQMEKGQIMKAYDDGAIETMQEQEGLDISKDQNGEESGRYYNKTYKEDKPKRIHIERSPEWP